MSEYFAIVVFVCIASLISIVLCILPMVLNPSRPDAEKLSAYECGFNPLSSVRKSFDIKFYLVSILFIIFDLEVVFLFPWSVSLSKIGYDGFWSMMVFFIILIIGFIYEWCKGALEWKT